MYWFYQSIVDGLKDLSFYGNQKKIGFNSYLLFGEEFIEDLEVKKIVIVCVIVIVELVVVVIILIEYFFNWYWLKKVVVVFMWVKVIF